MERLTRITTWLLPVAVASNGLGSTCSLCMELQTIRGGEMTLTPKLLRISA